MGKEFHDGLKFKLVKAAMEKYKHREDLLVMVVDR